MVNVAPPPPRPWQRRRLNPIPCASMSNDITAEVYHDVENYDNDITVEVYHDVESYDKDLPAFVKIEADIKLIQKKVGRIEAVLVDRTRIAQNEFLHMLDAFSNETIWIGKLLFESRLGRTRLASLRDHDQADCQIMYIKVLQVDEKYRCGQGVHSSHPSDVGAIALRKLLNHPFVKGTHEYACEYEGGHCRPKVTSAYYIVDPKEAMTQEESRDFKDMSKRCDEANNGDGKGKLEGVLLEEADKWDKRLDDLGRMDANQFLRNGFFQDRAYAEESENNGRILVASHQHWGQPLVTHEDAASATFCNPPDAISIVKPKGRDGELFEFIMGQCDGSPVDVMRMYTISVEVHRLLHLGASVARSCALHAACAQNALEFVDLLLKVEPSAVNGYDMNGCTPLMIAVGGIESHARNILDDIDTQVIDKLLEAGADKSLTDKKTMTAFGHFIQIIKSWELCMLSLTGTRMAFRATDVSVAALKQKLMAPDGPTDSDKSGERPNSGFIEYEY